MQKNLGAPVVYVTANGMVLLLSKELGGGNWKFKLEWDLKID